MVHAGGKSHKLLMMAPAYSFNYFLLYEKVEPAFRRRLTRSAKVQCRHCSEIYYGENSLYRETLKSYLISTFPFLQGFSLCADPASKIHDNAIYFAATRSARVQYLAAPSIQC
jgi:hypothetical protein